MDSPVWTASLDPRDRRVTKVTKERWAIQVAMEPDIQVRPARLDHLEKSSTGHLTIWTLLPEVPGLREDLVYLVKLDSLVLLDQRVTEETPARWATE